MKAKVSRVTQKGQVVIPMKLRKKLGIREGTAVTFLEEDDRLILQPLTKEFVAKLRDEAKFDSLDALVEQMHVDAAQARELLSRMNGG